jgi:transposase
MILNDLGFTNRRLYLTPKFFESKAIEGLLGTGVKAQHFDDHTLGKCLDEIFEYGATKLFGEIAMEIMLEQNLFGKIARLDSTSYSVTSDYETEESAAIEIVHGFLNWT